MIYRLTVECIEGWHYDHETIRIIDIDENALLYDLFDIVREANGFGFEHPHLFYLGRTPKNKKIIFGKEGYLEGFQEGKAEKFQQNWLAENYSDINHLQCPVVTILADPLMFLPTEYKRVGPDIYKIDSQ